MHNQEYYQQSRRISNFNGVPRFDFYRSLCEGRRVLHIGCADNPFVKEHNLHLYLKDKCLKLHGVDTDTTGIDTLVDNGIDIHTLANNVQYFENEIYDIVLIPEVIEHVKNLQDFFDNMNRINTSHYVVTAPCAIQCFNKGDIVSENIGRTADTHEIVHPEHLCWYTPYTLHNAINTYTTWTVDNLFWNNGISVGCVARK